MLELTCELPVIASVSDDASANRKFFRMHSMMDNSLEDRGVVHRTINLFAPSRYIWFFSDAPHLLKTTRNCIYHSGESSNHSRCLWNDGQHILRRHISRIADEDLLRGTKIIAKLTMKLLGDVCSLRH